MSDTQMISKYDTTTAVRLASMLVVALITVAVAGPAVADNPQTLAETMKTRPATGSRIMPGDAPEASEAETAAAQLAGSWGVEVASIRLTAHNHMIDYRYKVLDAEKAADLFKRQIKPQLIHQETGYVLSVPDTAKVGPLRNSNTPQNDRIYWMFFGNAGDLVKAGDRVTVVIGEYRVEDLVVE
jgi:hypothetical protein